MERNEGEFGGGRNLSRAAAWTKVPVGQGQRRVTAAGGHELGSVACPQPAGARTDAGHVKLFIFAAHRPFAPLLFVLRWACAPSDSCSRGEGRNDGTCPLSRIPPPYRLYTPEGVRFSLSITQRLCSATRQTQPPHTELNGQN